MQIFPRPEKPLGEKYEGGDEKVPKRNQNFIFGWETKARNRQRMTEENANKNLIKTFTTIMITWATYEIIFGKQKVFAKQDVMLGWLARRWKCEKQVDNK